MKNKYLIMFKNGTSMSFSADGCKEGHPFWGSFQGFLVFYKEQTTRRERKVRTGPFWARKTEIREETVTDYLPLLHVTKDGVSWIKCGKDLVYTIEQ